VIKKVAQGILKYKNLIIEIQRMWNVTAAVIPVITGATGTNSKSLRQYLNNLPGMHEINKLQQQQQQQQQNQPYWSLHTYYGKC